MANDHLIRRRGGYASTCDFNLDSPAVTSIRDLLAEGDTAPAEKAWSGTRDVNERAALLEAFSDWSDQPDFVEEWVSRKPSAVLPRLVRGAHFVTWAWVARGARRGSSVGDKAANLFVERLLKAKADLLAVTKADRTEVLGCVWLTKVGRGMGDSTLAVKAYEEGCKRDAASRLLHSWMLLLRCEKWGGSNEEMLDFARTAAAKGLAGAGLDVLIAEAHIEWSRTLDPPRDSEYMRQNAEELIAANRRCFHPSTGCTGTNAMRNRNWFALALWKAGAHQEARAHFEVIGKIPSESPWTQFPWIIDLFVNPYRRARRACLRA